MAVEDDVQSVFNYKVGVKARYLLFGDVFHFMASPSKLKLLPEFMKFYERDLSYDILSSDDFLPAVIRLLSGASSAFSREMWEYAYTRA